ncbi:PH domain-containing protein [Actinocorallia populi]|uniref:PH domain-containing protein n=1 Tax=Actinocorallia populi TaxID=2079200 RepID=UPI001E4CDD89|nr:PH domain-containing protein [Actinocorallia populi]
MNPHPYPPRQPYRPGWAPPPRPSMEVHRLHWATAPLRSLNIVVVYFVLIGMWLLLDPDDWFTLDPARILLFLLVTFPVALVAGAVGVWTWWAVRFWIDGDDLVVDTGVVRSRIRRIPLSRMQGVDVVSPLLGRLLGLAEVRLELAGGSSAEITLRYLGRRRAQELRAELVALAAGLPGHTPEAPERPFCRVGFGALFLSLVLRVPVLLAFALFVALVVFGIVTGELAVLGVAIPILLGLCREVAAPLVMYARFRSSIAPDGIRLRFGLLESRLQTVPPGRIQALRVVEPWMWRQFGWARVEMTVAGYGGERQALSSTLLPVGPREAAFAMVSEIFPGAPVEGVALTAARSRWRSADAAGISREVFVSRRGRFCRTWDVVDFARAQSVRLTASPVQRLLGLGTVQVDVPPGPVQVAAVDWELAQARGLADETVARTGPARARSGSLERWAG